MGVITERQRRASVRDNRRGSRRVTLNSLQFNVPQANSLHKVASNELMRQLEECAMLEDMLHKKSNRKQQELSRKEKEVMEQIKTVSDGQNNLHATHKSKIQNMENRHKNNVDDILSQEKRQLKLLTEKHEKHMASKKLKQRHELDQLKKHQVRDFKKQMKAARTAHYERESEFSHNSNSPRRLFNAQAAERRIKEQQCTAVNRMKAKHRQDIHRVAKDYKHKVSDVELRFRGQVENMMQNDNAKYLTIQKTYEKMCLELQEYETRRLLKNRSVAMDSGVELVQQEDGSWLVVKCTQNSSPVTKGVRFQ